MGDNFQIIADVEATEAEAPELAASVVCWLAARGIITGDPTDCVLGAEAGYPPGPDYAAALATPDGALSALRTNGVQVHSTKTVFSPVQGEFGPVDCPHCGHHLVLEDPATGELTPQWDPFNDALGHWWAGQPATVACPRCGRASALNDWHWTGDWPIAVGFLGLTFWNWPPLSQSFITQVAAHLAHRVVLTQGKC